MSFAGDLLDGGSWHDQGHKVFLRDRSAGETILVSQTLEGQPALGMFPTISPDGRYVGFLSNQKELAIDKDDELWDLFIRDMSTGLTRRVASISADLGAQDNDGPDFSADGRFVVFSSSVDGLVDGDENGREDVLLYDQVTGQLELVSVSTTGEQGNDSSLSPSISADGRFVVFDSGSDTLVAGDGNKASDVFVRDRMAGTTQRVSVSSSGEEV